MHQSADLWSLGLAGEIVFSIPSGGFGNGFSGYLTKRMGLPVKYFIPAVNDNDTLHRFFAHGSCRTHLSSSHLH